MNLEAQAELNRILSLDPADVTEADQAFLQARRSYMTEEQRIKFGVTAPESEVQNEPAKPSRKKISQ